MKSNREKYAVSEIEIDGLSRTRHTYEQINAKIIKMIKFC